MRCELCTRKLGASEIVNGVRYGTIEGATEMFLPARDSAPTIICSACSSILMKLIYAKLNKPTCQKVRPIYQQLF